MPQTLQNIFKDYWFPDGCNWGIIIWVVWLFLLGPFGMRQVTHYSYWSLLGSYSYEHNQIHNGDICFMTIDQRSNISHWYFWMVIVLTGHVDHTSVMTPNCRRELFNLWKAWIIIRGGEECDGSESLCVTLFMFGFCTPLCCCKKEPQ